MPVDPKTKAETARENGAKSHGPTTQAGKDRCRQAPKDAAARRAAVMTFDCTLLPTESRDVFEFIVSQECKAWCPSTPIELQLVHELVDINWKIKRLKGSQTNALLENMEGRRLRASASELTPIMAANAEAQGSAPGGDQINIDRRIAILSTIRSRIFRDLERLAKRFPTRGSSQALLQNKHLPIEISWKVPAAQRNREAETEPENILDWAKTKLDFTPDPPQADLMTTAAKDVLMLGGLQTGTSTAAAIRVVHEAVNHPESTILLAGPTGPQSGQIMMEARQVAEKAGLELKSPPPGCDGFKLPNGSQVISLPDDQSNIRGFSAPRLIVVDEAAFASDELFPALKSILASPDGRMFLLSTATGQSGHFYEKWRETGENYHKIFSHSEEEFNSEFTAPPGQFTSREPLHNAIRRDIKPLFPEDEP